MSEKESKQAHKGEEGKQWKTLKEQRQWAEQGRSKMPKYWYLFHPRRGKTDLCGRTNKSSGLASQL